MNARINSLLSALAIFLALGGTAYAALSVTSRDVRDGSLTGRDVRDGSIRAQDLQAKLRRPAPPGPRGPRGPAGPRGKTGLPGAAEAVFTRVAQAAVGSGGKAAVAGRLLLPSGSWVVNTTGVLTHSVDTPESARCQVLASVPDTELEIGETGFLPLPPTRSVGSRVSFAVTGAAQLDAETEVSVSCSSFREAPITVQDLAITAIRVTAVEER